MSVRGAGQTYLLIYLLTLPIDEMRAGWKTILFKEYVE